MFVVFSCPDPAVHHGEEEGHPQISGRHLCVGQDYHYPRGKKVNKNIEMFNKCAGLEKYMTVCV